MTRLVIVRFMRSVKKDVAPISQEHIGQAISHLKKFHHDTGKVNIYIHPSSSCLQGPTTNFEHLLKQEYDMVMEDFLAL